MTQASCVNVAVQPASHSWPIDKRSLSMLGNKWVSVVDAGRRVWTLDVLSCLVWVESNVVPFGSLTEMGLVAGVAV